MKKPVTVTITGAAGNIGYALAFRVASGQMLGPDQPINLNLLEIPAAGAAVQGVVMELNDCAFATLNKVVAASDAALGFRDCNFAMLVGARPRGPGMERKDLLLENAKIFSAQGKALDVVASRDVRVLVVGNPANTNSLIAQRNVAAAKALHRDDAPGSQSRPRATQGKNRRAVVRCEKNHNLGQSLGDPVSGSKSRNRRRQTRPVSGRTKLVQGHLYSDGAAARRGRHQSTRQFIGRLGGGGGLGSHPRLDARHAGRRLGKHGGSLGRQLWNTGGGDLFVSGNLQKRRIQHRSGTRRR